ncbi:L,D-transpeptidase [Lutibaculum baratangense]|nr:L,D-transpeptidase [Lutibaculum baratangense]
MTHNPENNGRGGLTRRGLVAGLPLFLAACNSGARPDPLAVRPEMPAMDIPARYVSMYGPMPNEQFPVPRIDLRQIDPRYWRREVPDPTGEAPGTIIVDTSGPFLYHVQTGGRAMRYGVGVGRQGFEWAGRATIQDKKPWPTWTPPASMIERQPELEKYRNGQDPGLDNPLGARALYLFQNGRDTLYRIHGTNEPWSIGKSMSSGCIRLLNQDIIHLYDNTTIGTPVLVKQGNTGWA